jgi:hypothetical protein
LITINWGAGDEAWQIRLGFAFLDEIVLVALFANDGDALRPKDQGSWRWQTEEGTRD